MRADVHIDALLRQPAPQVLGAMVRRYGHFDACEDAVQEALLAAAIQWPDQGIPENARADSARRRPGPARRAGPGPNQEYIREGIALVTDSLSRAPIGPYQLQAAIAAVHDEPARAEDTDWPQILALYELLERISDNPVITLNHAVAVAMVRGPQAGLDLLEDLDTVDRLAGHHRLDAVRAHLWRWPATTRPPGPITGAPHAAPPASPNDAIRDPCRTAGTRPTTLQPSNGGQPCGTTRRDGDVNAGPEGNEGNLHRGLDPDLPASRRGRVWRVCYRTVVNHSLKLLNLGTR